ncbi:protein FAM13A isoform X2 [Gouania willdenowi]|uniref:Rho-GAP domain-containing protein n=1 Tax=Gouania willdenowi TaxID=441366 RepID=A0A8C5G711_GOUWI|nr:protein FAM13A isoform X2 [Gouania willdenowi]
MGAGAMTICHNKTAVQVKEDMKKMVQIPILRPRKAAAQKSRLFGASLFDLRERGLVEDGVPLVVRRMVEHLRKHALHQEGLFRVNGSVRAVETLRQRLDSGEDVDVHESDSCTVASLLKQFLRDLPEGLVDSAVQQALIQHYQEFGDEGSCSDLRDLLQQLPDVHHSFLRYLCHFLTLVERHHSDNRMTAVNLATVFGPSVFHVATGFEAMRDQNICNKIMAKLIQNYSSIFEADDERGDSIIRDQSTLIIVKSQDVVDADTMESSGHLSTETPTPAPRIRSSNQNTPVNKELPNESSANAPKAKIEKKKVREGRAEGAKPRLSNRLPHEISLSKPVGPLTSGQQSPKLKTMETTPRPPQEISDSDSVEGLSSNQLYPVDCSADALNVLDSTIRSTVLQHLFDSTALKDERLENCGSTAQPLSIKVAPTARQRRRQQRQQQEEGVRQQERSRAAFVTNKENIPTSSDSTSASVGENTETGAGSKGAHGDQAQRTHKPRKSKHNLQLTDILADHTQSVGEHCEEIPMETYNKGKDMSRNDDLPSAPRTLSMKIQESPVTCDTGRSGEVRGSDSDCEKTSCQDVPRLDLTSLTEENNNWGEPIPAFPLQRESMDREEARLSPHVGGRLIRQLLEEDSDPMVSPRFYAYGQCQQYLDDTEVPPSPPNAHSFMSRRRSSSLGSCDDEKEELTTAQLTKRIHVLKKKIHRFEEKFEDERKYRPSHSDKAANPEVLRWSTELAKLRKELKEHKLMKSEEDLPPLTRQRSNTLPRSFGSQLEKKPQQEKVPKPPVDCTLDSILNKLQEKRGEVHRPEDIKDMTREQIAAEKVALQKALLHYESIHGRPVTKNERQIMKPLYDRYRLVKQILCRASTIPVIEEEDGSEDDSDAKTQFSVSVPPELSVISLLERMDEEAEGFISPVDELSPSKNVTDMRLSNLHSASMQELVVQLQEAREEKKRIRKNLKEFEEQFLRLNGRNVQKEDRTPLAEEYSEYKHLKAKLRLLEVLISKRDSTKLI